MKIDWKAKLTSRKFWAAVIGFVTALLIAFAVPQATITQVAGIITAGATLIAYIIGEGLVDAASASGSSTSGDSQAIAAAAPLEEPTVTVTETAQPETVPTVKTENAEATAATVPVPEAK